MDGVELTLLLATRYEFTWPCGSTNQSLIVAFMYVFTKFSDPLNCMNCSYLVSLSQTLFPSGPHPFLYR